jgi:hypothetical protein
VGVEVLQSYLGLDNHRERDGQDNYVCSTLHIGDQFLNTGNDYAARGICPCVWITSPEETTYILKSIIRLAGLSLGDHHKESNGDMEHCEKAADSGSGPGGIKHDASETARRSVIMDVYTGEILGETKTT